MATQGARHITQTAKNPENLGEKDQQHGHRQKPGFNLGTREG